MKSKQEFFEEFFKRLQKEGLTVNILPQSDVAAEVIDGQGQPFCSVTHDGDIVYENYNADTVRLLTGCAAKARQKTGACTEVPFKDLEGMDTVVLPKGSYYKIFESSTVLLLCRYSDMNLLHAKKPTSGTTGGNFTTTWFSMTSMRLRTALPDATDL